MPSEKEGITLYSDFYQHPCGRITYAIMESLLTDAACEACHQKGKYRRLEVHEVLTLLRKKEVIREEIPPSKSPKVPALSSKSPPPPPLPFPTQVTLAPPAPPAAPRVKFGG